MKGLLILIVLIGLGIWATYHFGGFATLDPAAQAAEINEKVKPGMTWQEVCDVREPRRYHVYDPAAEFNNWRERKFDRAEFTQAMNNGGVGEFMFRYNFSDAHASEVYFTQAGTVASVGKARTVADLFSLPGSQ